MSDPIEVNEDGSVVIRSAEQQEIMLQLRQLAFDCNDALDQLQLDLTENESLATESDMGDWNDSLCVDARRFISVTGGLGWIVTVSRADQQCARSKAYIADKLRNRGWEGVEVVTTW